NPSWPSSRAKTTFPEDKCHAGEAAFGGYRVASVVCTVIPNTNVGGATAAGTRPRRGSFAGQVGPRCEPGFSPTPPMSPSPWFQRLCPRPDAQIRLFCFHH